MDGIERRKSLSRRRFLRGAAAAAAAGGFLHRSAGAASSQAEPRSLRGRIFKAVKLEMFNERIPLEEKFRVLKDLGFDGVEFSSPGGVDPVQAYQASRKTGLSVHGAVDSIHWHTRLSDPDPGVRERAVAGLRQAIENARLAGGFSVLLVPGKVGDPQRENHDQVWERSIEGIRKVLPLAARLGVRILIENVWNGFCYDPEGGDDQTADRLARYIDEISSPWVGSYFDIGNHRRFGKPEEWIRTLGSRIVKLDVKDWGRKGGFTKIGDGDVDWAAVRKALLEIGFTGWATAEVAGGDRNRMREISERMDRAFAL